MQRSKGFYFIVEIECKKYPDACLSSWAEDEVEMDCGDFSEERMETVIAETNHKIRTMWAYLKERQQSLLPV